MGVKDAGEDGGGGRGREGRMEEGWRGGEFCEVHL